MSAPTPPSLVVPFAQDGDKNVIPIPSQIATNPGDASYTDGFPPATMTDPTLGGIPPSGFDMNGILYAISAHTAWLASGGAFYPWSQDVLDNWTGYAIGAIVVSDNNPRVLFQSLVNNNTTNPNGGPSNDWLQFPLVSQGAGVQTDASSGTLNDVAAGIATGFLELSNSAPVTITGMDASYDGQQVTISCTHATGSVTIAALNGGSLAANQFRLPADITLLQYMSATFKYSEAIGKWVQVS